MAIAPETARPIPTPAEKPPEVLTPSRLRPVALALLTAGLVGLCALVAAPLLPAITWAVALAVLLWPVQARLVRASGRPGLSALSLTAVVGLALIGGVVFVTYEIARTAGAAGANPNTPPGEAVREAGARYPVWGEMVQWAERSGIDIDGNTHELAGRASQGLRDFARGSIQTVMQLAVALFLLFHLLRDRQRMLGAAQGLIPLSPVETDRVIKRFGEAVFANLYANGVTSVIDSVSGFLVFWAVGLPTPALWAVIMFVLSLVPPFGASLIWGPAAAYLALTGQWPGAIAILVYGLVTWMLVDNVLYARLAGKGMGIHPAAALVAVLGGLAVFGAPGLVLGPAILAVTGAVFEVWKERRVAEGRRVR